MTPNIILLNLCINIQNRSFKYHAYFQYKPKLYILNIYHLHIWILFFAYNIIHQSKINIYTKIKNIIYFVILYIKLIWKLWVFKSILKIIIKIKF